LLISPTSVISNPAIAQQPYPGSEYIDIGLKVKATPTLHDNNEVTLQLEFEIKALSGANENGIPIISNRSVTQAVRLKEDETSLVTGLLDREETKTITGLPGFAELPVAGYLFGARDNSFTDDELLILITPRRVRAPIRDARSIYAGRGDTTGRASVGTGVAPVAPIPEPGQAPTGEQPPAEPTPGQAPAPPAPPQVPPPQPPPEEPRQEIRPPAPPLPQPQP
jgi:general secretion pathway protein D